MKNYLIILLKILKGKISEFAKDNNTNVMTINDIHNIPTYHDALPKAQEVVDDMVYEIVYIPNDAVEKPNIVTIIDDNSSTSMGGASKRLATSGYKSQTDQAA